jgi:hypothetical protein
MLNERMMKVMKKYSKPQTLVIPFNIRQCILTGSDPTGAKLNDSGFNANSEALSRQGFFGEDDEEYE